MTTIEKTCSCFGHSKVNITEELTARTRIEIDRAIDFGVRIFLFGGRSDFDDLCYDLVTEKRNANPQLDIKRVFCFALDMRSKSKNVLLIYLHNWCRPDIARQQFCCLAFLVLLCAT